MIRFDQKIVESVGWAGPLLWVCTVDGYTIHFYDGRIELDGAEIMPGEDRPQALVGREIASVAAGPGSFSVTFRPDATLRVLRADVQTARFFKRGDLQSHWIYKDGTVLKDTY